ncbi:unnamed protein product [Prunus brigantina]
MTRAWGNHGEEVYMRVDKKCNHHHTNGKSKYSPTESLEMDLKIIWKVKGSG